jgi:hypothetical protein
MAKQLTCRYNYLCKDMFKKSLQKMFRPLPVALALMVLAAFAFTAFVPAPNRYHSPIEQVTFRMTELTTATGEFMTGSGNCVNCHNTDPNGLLAVDALGNDVSPVNDWRATMMANAAKDPFWKAKVRHEVLETPSLANEIEHTCTACHAPQGHSEFEMTGQAGHYTMEYLSTDELGLDGVGCIGCHAIADVDLANTFNGNQTYNADNIAYGTFTDPWASPMIQQTGFAPVYSPHMGESEMCAGCHSLFVQTVDFEGNSLGITFFEQATYHEWLNSVYDEQQVECQTCHMPEAEGGASAATSPSWLFPRPFKKHYFVGGNSFMVKLMQENAEALGLTASDANFDAVVERTEYLLQEESLNMTVSHLNTTNDTAVFAVDLANLAGHKFPSGYPSRLLSIEFVVRDEANNVLFQSGGFDADYEILGRDLDWEPHHDVIRGNDQVQIYEMVFADVSGTPTTVLERAHTLLKDNRMVPTGFTTSHLSYDTVRIAGVDESDLNFNRLNGIEGSGTDRIEYRVGVNGYVGPISVEARAWYQSVPPRWMEEMFAWDDAEIQSFKSMFDAADQSPVLVQEQIFGSTTNVMESSLASLTLGPNPTRDGVVRIWGEQAHWVGLECGVFDLNGRMVVPFKRNLTQRIILPATTGVYHVVVRDTSGAMRVWKVLRE